MPTSPEVSVKIPLGYLAQDVNPFAIKVGEDLMSSRLVADR